MEDFFHYLIGGIRISNMAHAAVWECVLLLLIRFGKSNYVLGKLSTFSSQNEKKTQDGTKRWIEGGTEKVVGEIPNLR